MKIEKRVTTIEHRVFIASDGKEFQTEWQCKEHEDSITALQLAPQIEEMTIASFDSIYGEDYDTQYKIVDIKNREAYETFDTYLHAGLSQVSAHEPEAYPAIMVLARDFNNEWAGWKEFSSFFEFDYQPLKKAVELTEKYIEEHYDKK